MKLKFGLLALAFAVAVLAQIQVQASNLSKQNSCGSVVWGDEV